MVRDENGVLRREGSKPSENRPLKPDRAACLECHEGRQVSDEVFPAAKAPMKWECGKCHKPHERLSIGNGECRSCHNTMTEGVHRVKGHSECLDCHRPHAWTTMVANCTGCHAAIVPARSAFRLCPAIVAQAVSRM